MRGFLSLFILLVSFGSYAKTGRLNMEWEKVPGVAVYEVELKPGRGKALQFQTKEPVLDVEVPEGSYQLRVRGLDEEGYPGDWSSPEEVRIRPLPPIEKFPADGAVIKYTKGPALDIRFRWDAVKNSVGYVLQLKRGEKIESYTSSSTSLTIKKIQVGQQLQWRVDVLQSSDVLQESRGGFRTFTVIGRQLTTPDMQKLSLSKSEVAWPAVPEAKTYEVEVRFRKLLQKDWSELFKGDSASPTVVMKTALGPGEYWVRIRAKGSLISDSKWADTKYFFKPSLSQLSQSDFLQSLR